MSSKWRNVYATFVCWPGFAYRAVIIACTAFVLFYEAINGFHDTANAVEPLSIPARCVLSSPWLWRRYQLFGCFAGWSECCLCHCAYAPTDLLLNMGSSHGLAMVFSSCWRRLSGTWVPGTLVYLHPLSYADWRDHRDWFNQCVDDRTSVVDALNIPKVLSIFGSLTFPLLSAWCLLAV